MEGNGLTNEIRFYPLLVSSSGELKQSETESDAVWEKLDQIPEANKKILLSESIIRNLYAAEQTFAWSPFISTRLAYFVRELFFQNISQSEFYKALEALLAPQHGQRLNEILVYVNNVLLMSQPDKEETESEERDLEERNEFIQEHVLLDALAKYPNISNQTLSTERIKLKSSAELVRPTLSNWLKNYRDELGIGLHDAVTRAKFLFESPNTRNLPGEERDRIHALIRSLEDNELLQIDTKKQQIIFSQPRPTVSQEKNTSVQSAEVSPDIFERFQSIGTNPLANREELKAVGTQTFVSTEIKAGVKNDEQAILSRIKNMFVKTPKANEPAPHEDFIQDEMPAEQALPSEPLGTIRFSAKHVFPSERKEFSQVTIPAKTIADPRLEHFRPREVPIPQQNQIITKSDQLPSETILNTTTNITSDTAAPQPQVVTPAPLPQEPISIFRIKPNRD